MKNLQAHQTEIFDKYGIFFAFSNEQFEKAMKPDVKYVSLGAGMYAQKDNYKIAVEALDALHAQHVKDELAEKGKKKLIHEELANHEAQITYSIDDTFDALESYGITREEIQAEFSEYMDYCIKHDCF